MTFTRRLTLVAATAVAVIAVLGSVLTYVLVRGELRGEVDRSLRGSARAAQRLSAAGVPRGLRLLRARRWAAGSAEDELAAGGAPRCRLGFGFRPWRRRWSVPNHMPGL